MTAISVFSTFTNKHDMETLKFKNLENVYMLSDSQLSFYDGKNFRNFENRQKIFYDKNASVIMGVAGMYDIGKKIIRNSLNAISISSAVLNAQSIDAKIDEIANIVALQTVSFHTNNFKFPTTIVCNTVCNKIFASVKFFIPAGTNIVTKVDCDIMEKIAVTSDGMDGKPFEKFVLNSEGKLDIYLTPATKHFTLFLDFLNSNLPFCSGPPCQGVVLSFEGQIKELSIKHRDGKFYKMGILHEYREILKCEIDYRDESFQFLSASKIK